MMPEVPFQRLPCADEEVVDVDLGIRSGFCRMSVWSSRELKIEIWGVFLHSKLKNAMATNRTFTMIKPDATGAGHTGKIIDRIIDAGFSIKAMKWTQLSLADAQAFYAVHAERPFFGELTEYMSSAPIVAAILEKDNAVADFRTLIGATNPAEAAPGTIRADFAESIAANAVHGSDSDDNAAIEGAFYFSARELA
jgi:nucleoside-diphosphate kinase